MGFKNLGFRFYEKNLNLRSLNFRFLKVFKRNKNFKIQILDSR